MISVYEKQLTKEMEKTLIEGMKDPESQLYYEEYKRIHPQAGRLYLAVMLHEVAVLAGRDTAPIQKEANEIAKLLFKKKLSAENTEKIGVLLNYWDSLNGEQTIN